MANQYGRIGCLSILFGITALLCALTIWNVIEVFVFSNSLDLHTLGGSCGLVGITLLAVGVCGGTCVNKSNTIPAWLTIIALYAGAIFLVAGGGIGAYLRWTSPL
jgi:hypothetical protein